MTFCRWDLEYIVYRRKHKICTLWNFGILGHFLQNYRSWQKDYWYLRNKTSTSCAELNKKVIENKTCTLFSIFTKSVYWVLGFKPRGYSNNVVSLLCYLVFN